MFIYIYMVIQILGNIKKFSMNNLITNTFKLFMQQFDETHCKQLNISDDYTYVNIIKTNDVNKILHIASLLGIDLSSINISDIIVNTIDYVKSDLINNMIDYYFKHDNISNMKEYCDNFANNNLYEYISKLLNVTSSTKMLSGCYKYSKLLTNISSCQIITYELKPLVTMDLLLNNKPININVCNILQTDIQPTKYQTIFFDLHVSYKNLIHAQCCNKIKNLKLRGTKSEPLFIQFITETLDINGKACVIVPDHFLFNNSNQHTITRQYLLTKFNVISIIQIDEEYYHKKNQKYSLIYFENNKKTNNTVDFMRLNINGELENIINVNMMTIIDNNYLLYYKTYTDNTNKINTLYNGKVISLNEVFDFVNNIDNKAKEYIVMNKVFKNNNSININSFTNNTNTYLVERHNNLFTTDFLNYYIMIHLKSNMNKCVKGITNMYDINAIKQLTLPLLSKDMQSIIVDYINSNNEIINNNNKLIDNYTNIKMNVIKMSIFNNDTEPILNVCNLLQCNELKNNVDTISINKNGQKTGYVSLIKDTMELKNNNVYYITSNSNYNIMYVYYWLWYNHKHIFEISNLKEQPLLTRYIFQTLNIHKLSLEKQSELVRKCNMYDTMINKCYQDINHLQKEKEIFMTNI